MGDLIEISSWKKKKIKQEKRLKINEIIKNTKSKLLNALHNFRFFKKPPPSP